MEVALHLGVHKTATTYLQKTLEANQSQLAKAGAAYLPLNATRTLITQFVTREPSSVPAKVRAVLERFADCRRLILSDENILGLCDVVRDGAYYAAAKERLGALVEALAGNETRIFVAVRSYDAFISSMYCEYVRHFPFVTPDEYLAAVDVDRLDWCDLVGGLCEIVGAEHATFWRFEDFGEVEDTVLPLLGGAPSLAVRKPHNLVRASLSKSAVSVLRRLQPFVGRENVRKFVPTVALALPKRGRDTAFRAFDEDRAAALRSRYERDVARLELEFPLLNVIRPASEVLR